MNIQNFHTTLVERVQKRFTKRLPGFRHYNYAERLQLLQLETLEARRVKADLILCYKIVYWHVDLDKNELFNFAATSCTRGHDLKNCQKAFCC